MTNDGETIPQIRGEGVYGIHSVLQVLESQHRQIHKLYVRDPTGVTAKKSAADVQALERIKMLADASGVEMATTRYTFARWFCFLYRYCYRVLTIAWMHSFHCVCVGSKWMLNHITSDKPHQVSPRLLLCAASRYLVLRLAVCVLNESHRA